MSRLRRLFERSPAERHTDNRVLTGLTRGAGWEFEPAQRVVTAVAAQRVAHQPINLRAAIEDELRGDGPAPCPERVTWAVAAVERELSREGAE